MPRFGGEHREEEVGTHRRGGAYNRQISQGLTGNWLQDKSGEGESAPALETLSDVGKRRRVQGQAAEAGGWRLKATPMWVAHHTGKGAGDPLKREGFENEQLRMGRR